MTVYEKLMTQKEKKAVSNLPEMKRVELIAEDKSLSKDLFFNDLLIENFSSHHDTFKSGQFRFYDEVVVFQFCLQGECALTSKTGTKLLSLKASEFNIFSIPQKGKEMIFCAANANVISIYLDKDFFFKHISEEHRFYRLKNVLSFTVAVKENLYISPKIKNVINEISTCAFEGHLKDLYTKAKVIEAIALMLMQYEEEKPVLSPLKQRDIDKMNQVKTMIDNNPDESYTIAYLARAVGTNEQYLKNHFKILFGQTVFKYILSCKMERAREMILSEKYRIADIAELTGYKHATHFTNAFKKFFGYLPLTLKSKINIITLVYYLGFL